LMHSQLQSTQLLENNGETTPVERTPLGYVDWDSESASNERVIMRAPLSSRDRISRDQYVRIEDPLGSRSGFLGRIVGGPFFSPGEASPNHGSNGKEPANNPEVTIVAEIELQGELVEGRQRVSKSRPLSRAVVQELSDAEVAKILGFAGDMVLGAVSGQENIFFRLQ